MKTWRYEDMKIWRYEDMKIWRYEGMKIWRYEDIKIWRYEGMKIWRYEDMKISKQPHTVLSTHTTCCYDATHNKHRCENTRLVIRVTVGRDYLIQKCHNTSGMGDGGGGEVWFESKRNNMKLKGWFETKKKKKKGRPLIKHHVTRLIESGRPQLVEKPKGN